MHPAADPDSDIVRDALTRRCGICTEPVGQHCNNMPINGGPVPGRVVHFERTTP